MLLQVTILIVSDGRNIFCSNKKTQLIHMLTRYCRKLFKFENLATKKMTFLRIPVHFSFKGNLWCQTKFSHKVKGSNEHHKKYLLWSIKFYVSRYEHFKFLNWHLFLLEASCQTFLLLSSKLTVIPFFSNFVFKHKMKLSYTLSLEGY